MNFEWAWSWESARHARPHYFPTDLMTLAMCAGIRMNTLTFFGFTFSVNQDDFWFNLKLRGCHACQPRLFFAADLMALAMFLRICMNSLNVFRLSFSGNQDDFWFNLKMRGCQACQPWLFLAADPITLLIFLEIRMTLTSEHLACNYKPGWVLSTLPFFFVEARKINKLWTWIERVRIC